MRIGSTEVQQKGKYMNKKWLVRAAVVIGIFMATVLISAPAMAMWSWCDVDPVLNIGGHTVHVQAFIQGDPQKIHGNVEFTVSVPKGTKISVISIDPTYKIQVTISYYTNKSSSPGIPVAVTVKIGTKEAYPTNLVVSVDTIQVANVLGTTKDSPHCNFIIY